MDSQTNAPALQIDDRELLGLNMLSQSASEIEADRSECETLRLMGRLLTKIGAAEA